MDLITKIFLWTLVVIVTLYLLFFIFWKVWFLRNPERLIPEGDVIVSPADGRVIKIIEFNETNIDEIVVDKGLFGKIKTYTDFLDSGYIVSIFMSPLDVHYNRMPVSGKIIKQEHKDGKLLAVNTFENGLLNEKNELIIENEKIGKLKVIQIAGFLARRIESFVKVNETHEKGEVFGLINLGSQVTLVLPKNVNLTVSVGDKVKAGSSVIANYR